jgi:hypothetical protein
MCVGIAMAAWQWTSPRCDKIQQLSAWAMGSVNPCEAAAALWVQQADAP